MVPVLRLKKMKQDPEGLPVLQLRHDTVVKWKLPCGKVKQMTCAELEELDRLGRQTQDNLNRAIAELQNELRRSTQRGRYYQEICGDANVDYSAAYHIMSDEEINARIAQLIEEDEEDDEPVVKRVFMKPLPPKRKRKNATEVK
jgi:hypothetical protein